jgi:hypothetical protein
MRYLQSHLKRVAAQPAIILPAIALLIIVAVWLSSLPHYVAIINDPLPDPTGEFSGILQPLDDSGGFLIAWHTWGVTHAPGYPLLSLVANVGTRLLDPLGLYPITAANILSLFFAAGAFVLMARPLTQYESSGAAVAAAYLLPAFGALVWLYAVVAEAYAFGLLLGFGSLSLALALGQRPTRRKALLLGLLFGLAIGHHRTLIALTPALIVAAWPARQLGWRVILTAAGIAAASLLIYLYLPIVAWAGSPWVYGRSPTTWDGLMDAFLVREYTARLTPPTTLPGIVAALDGRLRYLAQEISGLGLAMGLFGFLPGLIHRETRRLSAALLLAFCGYWLAPVSQALLILSYMMILVASLTLAASWGVGLIALGRWQRWLPPLGLLLTMGVAFNNFQTHREYVLFHTQDDSGRQIVADAANFPGEAPVVGEIWGPRIFPLAYGKLVGGELPHIQLVDLRADLSGLPDDLPELIFIHQSVLYIAGPEQWREKYGPAVAFGSQGELMIAVRATPVLEPIAPRPLAATDDIQLVAGKAELKEDGNLTVSLLWQAIQSPGHNYSVFIHVTDKEHILSPDDLIAQGDRIHPVAGFYPTSSWRAGEKVQDNHLVLLPADRAAQKVIVGLYTVDENGNFSNHLSHELQMTRAQD